ncbi:MAG: hypothetical protein Q9M16_05775 [Mariprofundus sp.]|nr:hypothetical protein [Mariprofundus sp.]
MKKAMYQIFEIAHLTFSDAIRNRISYGVFVFLIIIITTSIALASVTMGRTELMILDLGLGAISILGNLMAIVITIQTLQQEKENRTLYVLITRLDGRWKYLLGKFCGLAAVLGLQIIAMCALLALSILPFGDIYWLSFIQASIATVIEIWLVIAIAMLFAQSSSLFLAILFTVSVDITGRFTSVIQQFGEQASSTALRGLTETMFYILPNLEAVNLRNGAGYIESFPAAQFANVIMYGASEIAFLLFIGMIIFERRNLS